MAIDLTAPRYEAAASFEAPRTAPFELSVDTLSLAEALSAPGTKAIYSKHAPWVLLMAQAPQSAIFVSNFTLRDAAVFMPMDTSKGIAAVDAALRSLPRSEWPANVR
jgi:hypothetical protein